MTAPRSDSAQPNGRLKKTKTFVMWNVFTGVVIILILVVAGVFVQIYANPYHSVNPFPPPTMPAAIVLPILDNIDTPVNVALTEQPSVEATLDVQMPSGIVTTVVPDPATQTLQPTVEMTVALLMPTLTATQQPDIILITPIPEGTDPAYIFFTPTATPRLNYLYPYTLQHEPYSVDAKNFTPQRDCKWSGVGGQVFDLQGRPVTGVTVQLGGILEKRQIKVRETLTGASPQYGPAGYELMITDHPLDTYEKLWVRLMDQAGNQLSARTPFNTSANCDQNLVLVNFQQKK